MNAWNEAVWKQAAFFYAGMKKILKKVIKNIDIEIDTWYINTALFGRRCAEIFENWTGIRHINNVKQNLYEAKDFVK